MGQLSPHFTLEPRRSRSDRLEESRIDSGGDEKRQVDENFLDHIIVRPQKVIPQRRLT